MCSREFPHLYEPVCWHPSRSCTMVLLELTVVMVADPSHHTHSYVSSLSIREVLHEVGKQRPHQSRSVMASLSRSTPASSLVVRLLNLTGKLR